MTMYAVAPSEDPTGNKFLDLPAPDELRAADDSFITTLHSGARVGCYEILASIGAGGMGDVYRARDTKLGRNVAIKVLRRAFADPAGRIARFDREAQVLAALNHSNIAAIYGQEGRALVMELVEGSTLAQKIQEGPIPLKEALQIARQIVDALEYAHEKGIVHRDLKPANIKLTPNGTVKVLDFGLATLGSNSGGDSADSTSPTLTMAVPINGRMLGTVAYMAPEQARGKSVDKRADIWAFGVVLYEMLTGTRPFGGETVPDTLAAVLTRDLSLDLVPVPVRRLLRRCLDKDPRQRLRDIGDVRFLMDEVPLESAARSPRWLPWAVLGVVLAACATGLLLLWLHIDS